MNVNDAIVLLKRIDMGEADLRSAIADLETQAKQMAWDPTESEWESIALMRALTDGKVDVNECLEPALKRSLLDLANRGFLVAYDRLGNHLELTPAGHRYLPSVVDGYRPPAGLFVYDHWADPEALLGRLAWLLSDRGKAEIKRFEPPAPFISKKSAAAIAAAARDLAAYDAPHEDQV